MNKENKCVDVEVSAHIGECENESVEPITTPEGPTTIKVPVTLAELNVKTNLVAKICFPDPVLEIKDIKKRVEIVQCRLLLPGIPEYRYDDDFPFEKRTLRLFIKGFVRKNIQYATPSPRSKDCGVSSEIKSFTVKVPFECVTTIKGKDFLTPPQLPFHNNRSEFDFFRAQELGKGFPEKDEFLSSDLSQFHQVSTQFYNELPFCELLRSDIVEWDEAVDRHSFPDSPLKEGVFHELIEKMCLEFTIKVLQNQQVRVMALPPEDHRRC
ncbi:CsxC family protein [Niallia sp. Krafla_26]|uniref:CsxC family protein n=1 Tax=Niallia sp. Krafla_26 TaxID=3064703 RepID=UPI003D18657F